MKSKGKSVGVFVGIILSALVIISGIVFLTHFIAADMIAKASLNLENVKTEAIENYQLENGYLPSDETTVELTTNPSTKDDVTQSHTEQSEESSAERNKSNVDNTISSTEKSTESAPDVATFDMNTENLSRDENGDYIYIIQKNDTLSKLSATFGYSVDEIARYNEIKNVNKIYTGSALRIPHK